MANAPSAIASMTSATRSAPSPMRPQRLGFSARLIDGLDSAAMAQTLGLDRKSDFLRAEAEEPDLLLEIFPTAEHGEAAPPILSDGAWTGQANLLDRHPMYRWPIIDEAAAATKGAGIEIFGGAPPLAPIATRQYPADIILQRRSAQHFDAKGVMPAARFFKMLDALLVRPQTPLVGMEFPAPAASGPVRPPR